jgi:hypothetical protein
MPRQVTFSLIESSSPWHSNMSQRNSAYPIKFGFKKDLKSTRCNPLSIFFSTLSTYCNSTIKIATPRFANFLSWTACELKDVSKKLLNALLQLKDLQRLTPEPYWITKLGLLFGFTWCVLSMKSCQVSKLFLQTWQDGCATVSFLGTSTSEACLSLLGKTPRLLGKLLGNYIERVCGNTLNVLAYCTTM